MGVLGMASSVLMTIGFALLSSRGVASADNRIDPSAARGSRPSFIRELGGAPRTPTPSLGVAGSASANALRPLRRIGRAGTNAQGAPLMSLAGAVPFSDDAPRATGAVAVGDVVASVQHGDGDDAGAIGQANTLLSAAGRDLVQAQATPAPLGRQTAPAAPTAQPRPGQSWAAPPPTATPVPTRQPAIVFVTPTPIPSAAPAAPTRTPLPAAPSAAPSAPPAPGSASAFPPVVAPPTATPAARATTPPYELFPATTSQPAAASSGQPTSTTSASTTSATTSQAPSSGAASFGGPSTGAAPSSGSASGASSSATASNRSEPAPILGERNTRPAARNVVVSPSLAEGSEFPSLRSAEPGPRSASQGLTAASSVPAPTPSPNEPLAARALAAVNAARTQADALPLGRHPSIDGAAWMHAQYDVANGQKDTNFEAPNSPLFVGETPAARVGRANAGRLPQIERVGEIMALGQDEPEQIVQGWLDSVYHRVLLLDQQAQYGGFGQHGEGAATSAVLDLGGRRESGSAGWFPSSGATNVPLRCVCDDYAEASGRSGSFGYPVTLLLGSSRPSGQPSVARLTEGAENGTEVAADLVDAFDSPTLVPRAPLKPGQRYTARFQWSGGPDLRWSFTTRQ